MGQFGQCFITNLTFIAFEETHVVVGQFSFSAFFIGHHLGSTFTGRDRMGLISESG